MQVRCVTVVIVPPFIRAHDVCSTPGVSKQVGPNIDVLNRLISSGHFCIHLIWPPADQGCHARGHAQAEGHAEGGGAQPCTQRAVMRLGALLVCTSECSMGLTQ